MEKMDWANDHYRFILTDVWITILPSLTSTIFGECSLSMSGAWLVLLRISCTQLGIRNSNMKGGQNWRFRNICMIDYKLEGILAFPWEVRSSVFCATRCVIFDVRCLWSSIDYNQVLRCDQKYTATAARKTGHGVNVGKWSGDWCASSWKCDAWHIWWLTPSKPEAAHQTSSAWRVNNTDGQNSWLWCCLLLQLGVIEDRGEGYMCAQ